VVSLNLAHPVGPDMCNGRAIRNFRA